jgi:hypothetical protein
MNAATTMPADAVASLQAEVAALWAVVDDQAARLARLEQPPRPPPRASDRALLAEIVALVVDAEPFQCGDYVDPDRAKLWGEALARLLPHSPVDGFEITRLGKVGRRRLWVVRAVA